MELYAYSFVDVFDDRFFLENQSFCKNICTQIEVILLEFGEKKILYNPCLINLIKIFHVSTFLDR